MNHDSDPGVARRKSPVREFPYSAYRLTKPKQCRRGEPKEAETMLQKLIDRVLRKTVVRIVLDDIKRNGLIAGEIKTLLPRQEQIR